MASVHLQDITEQNFNVNQFLSAVDVGCWVYLISKAKCSGVYRLSQFGTETWVYHSTGSPFVPLPAGQPQTTNLNSPSGSHRSKSGGTEQITVDVTSPKGTYLNITWIARNILMLIHFDVHQWWAAKLITSCCCVLRPSFVCFLWNFTYLHLLYRRLIGANTFFFLSWFVFSKNCLKWPQIKPLLSIMYISYFAQFHPRLPRFSVGFSRGFRWIWAISLWADFMADCLLETILNTTQCKIGLHRKTFPLNLPLCRLLPGKTTLTCIATNNNCWFFHESRDSNMKFPCEFNLSTFCHRIN